MTDQVCKSRARRGAGCRLHRFAKILFSRILTSAPTCRRIDVSKSSALHLHDVIHRRHHALVEMAHDPDRTADDERDDQNAES